MGLLRILKGHVTALCMFVVDPINYKIGVTIPFFISIIDFVIITLFSFDMKDTMLLH